jgi:hypothetical protein
MRGFILPGFQMLCGSMVLEVHQRALELTLEQGNENQSHRNDEAGNRSSQALLRLRTT